MNPNSISHRLFAAALSPETRAPAPRPVRLAAKSIPKTVADKAELAPTRRANRWSWSGWYYPTM
jgi:hypothetical protein